MVNIVALFLIIMSLDCSLLDSVLNGHSSIQDIIKHVDPQLLLDHSSRKEELENILASRAEFISKKIGFIQNGVPDSVPPLDDKINQTYLDQEHLIMAINNVNELLNNRIYLVGDNIDMSDYDKSLWPSMRKYVDGDSFIVIESIGAVDTSDGKVEVYYADDSDYSSNVLDYVVEHLECIRDN